MLLHAFIQGFMLMGGLIIAIGAQNAFILTQGLKQQYVLPLVLFCSFADAGLSALGVAGLGHIITQNPILMDYIKLGGAAFLGAYAILALKRALKAERLSPLTQTPASFLKVMAIIATLTFLNPHVYLDTVVLVGAFANKFASPLNWVFWSGGVVASLLWFSALGFGAKWLVPFFQSATTWRILDGLIAFIMATLAIMLLLS